MDWLDILVLIGISAAICLAIASSAEDIVNEIKNEKCAILEAPVIGE